ncbi:hypothetical protein [Candidatus Lokiarchaeum ossiferum]|uniref:hypothetical protein n=1 Tax=Candidatus Lokiarchaeum ossiferum TaxID=2951803 RepID=UPI00352D3FED
MVVLETTLVFKNTVLVEKLYPAGKSGDFLTKDIRTGLLNSLTHLAERAFQDKLQNVSLGPYQIIQISQEIRQKKKDSPIDFLSMYTIAQKNTNSKEVVKCMQKAMQQFIDRYSIFDIYSLNQQKFLKFADRFEKIFSKLIISDEERFRAVF